jgi:uncharacterized cofD-like protein
MEQLMNYRFESGSLSGHSFGNLFLAVLNDICPTFDQAVERMHDVLAVTGRVLPVTTSDVYLEAEFENGAKVLGESKIFSFKKDQDCRIHCVRLVPQNPPALPGALKAIHEADYIVLGPGSLYTSIIPNLLVDGVVDAIMEADALKVYICNVMTQEGESEGYTAYDHVHELIAHSKEGLFKYCLVNDAPVPTEILERYKSERAEYLKVDTEAFENSGIEVIARPLFDEQNNYARHNPRRLAYELYRLMIDKKPRECDLGLLDNRLLKWLESRL